MSLRTRLQRLEAALRASGKCCPCPTRVLFIEDTDELPPEYLAPCPVDCPCHRRQGVRVIIISQHPPPPEATAV
jgi:hypothetical protein